MRPRARLAPLSAGCLGLRRDMNPLLIQCEQAYEAVQEQSNGNSLKGFRRGKGPIKMHFAPLDTFCNSNLSCVPGKHTDPNRPYDETEASFPKTYFINWCVCKIKTKLLYRKEPRKSPQGTLPSVRNRQGAFSSPNSTLSSGGNQASWACARTFYGLRTSTIQNIQHGRNWVVMKPHLHWLKRKVEPISRKGKKWCYSKKINAPRCS